MQTEKITDTIKIAVIGLGYVGLPLARLFSKKFRTIGFDKNSVRVDSIMAGHDSTMEVDDRLLQDAISSHGLTCTADIEDIRDCNFYVVAVPTPVDINHNPDLSPLEEASRTVGKVIGKGDIVVYESTVYPGVTEEECIPVIEKVSGLKLNADFYAGYSPERVNPGDKQHTVENIRKITSGSTPETAELIDKVYNEVLEGGTYKASSIKVAEAAKVIENSQRDINIAFVNELSKIFTLMGIDTLEVLEAAATKWNFIKMNPGLVGGHCISVDPYYLVHKAKELQYHPKMINSGRFVNDSMGRYIAKKIVKKILGQGKNILGARVLILGVTFKENVCDIRNTKVVDMVQEFRDFGARVDVMDAYASSSEVERMYGFPLITKPEGPYDAIVVAVPHTPYLSLTEDYFLALASDKPILGDLKGIYRGRIHRMIYWSL